MSEQGNGIHSASASSISSDELSLRGYAEGLFVELMFARNTAVSGALTYALFAVAALTATVSILVAPMRSLAGLGRIELSLVYAAAAGMFVLSIFCVVIAVSAWNAQRNAKLAIAFMRGGLEPIQEYRP